MLVRVLVGELLGGLTPDARGVLVPLEVRVLVKDSLLLFDTVLLGVASEDATAVSDAKEDLEALTDAIPVSDGLEEKEGNELADPVSEALELPVA